MTEQEAIERLKCMRLFMQINDDGNDSKFLEDDYIANDMAIKALEELEHYRALGTVEELINKDVKAMVDRTELALYKELGTLEELRVARDKQIPKKPVLVTRGLIKFYPCPNADCSNPNKYMQVYPNQKYCVYCGQKLDWEEV